MKEILLSENEFSKTDYERLKKNIGLYKNNLINSDGNMYLTVDLLIETNNIINGWSNITQKKEKLMLNHIHMIKFRWTKT